MPLITDATAVWSAPVSLITDEVWQARQGTVFVTTAETPDAEDGLALHELHAVHFSAGVTIRYRRGDIAAALIAREQV